MKYILIMIILVNGEPVASGSHGRYTFDECKAAGEVWKVVERKSDYICIPVAPKVGIQ